MNKTAMTKPLIAAAALATLSAAAAPTVTDITMTQKSTQRVEVTYTLNEDAVVTFDVLTNAPGGAWVSIGHENVTHLSGDVNKLVTGAGEHTLYWSADRSWVEDPARPADVKAQVRAWATNAPPTYMVIDLAIAENSNSTADFVRYYESAEQLPDGGLANDIYRTERLVMRRIPAKNVEWRMGSPSGQTWAGWGGAPETAHYVTLTEDYYMAVFETTIHQFHYMGGPVANYLVPRNNKSWVDLRGAVSSYDFPANGHAVDSNSAIGKLRTLAGGIAFDLPTEAQWEYACRAGEGGPFSPAIDMSDTAAHSDYTTNFSKIGWCTETKNQTQSDDVHRVGEKMPNAWGLYDMHGNVAEWCLDWYKGDLGSASVTDPTVAVSERSLERKVLRGGSSGWCEQYKCRSASRNAPITSPSGSAGNVGFRLVCPAVAK